MDLSQVWNPGYCLTSQIFFGLSDRSHSSFNEVEKYEIVSLFLVQDWEYWRFSLFPVFFKSLCTVAEFHLQSTKYFLGNLSTLHVYCVSLVIEFIFALSELLWIVTRAFHHHQKCSWNPKRCQSDLEASQCPRVDSQSAGQPLHRRSYNHYPQKDVPLLFSYRQLAKHYHHPLCLHCKWNHLPHHNLW
jgi:hypothetical protein